MVAGTYDTDKRKLLSSLCHGAIFFSATILSIGLPVAILIVSDDPITKDNARESINFHFNVWLYGILFGLLCWVLIGWPLLGILLIVQFVMPILAIIHCLRETETAYRYPFIFRLV